MQELKSDKDKIKFLKAMFSLLFKVGTAPMKLLDYQCKIAKPIFFQESKRIVITSPTRAGKSFTIALIALLIATLKPNYKIKLIAPTYKQTKIIMGYIFEHIADHNTILQNTTLSADKAQALGKTLNQNQIGFLNGSSIELLSAEGEGARLMGFGGDLIIVDESALIKDEVFRTRIMRMLGDQTTSMLIEIGNPLEVNHFYEHWMNPEWYHVHIHWTECVGEGRLSKKYVDEQRDMLTPIEFRRLYDAEFVVTQDDSLFDYEKIQEALKKETTLKEKETDIYFGIDVARLGVDWNVISIIKYDGENYILTEFVKWHGKDLMSSVGRIKDAIEKHKPKCIRVDESGVGGGVLDRLREQGVSVDNINFGASAKQPKRFINLKAEAYAKLAELLVKGRIQLPKDAKLIDQMIKIKFDKDSEAKLKIVDDHLEHSQDELDSLVIGLYAAHSAPAFFFINREDPKKPSTASALPKVQSPGMPMI